MVEVEVEIYKSNMNATLSSVPKYYNIRPVCRNTKYQMFLSGEVFCYCRTTSLIYLDLSHRKAY